MSTTESNPKHRRPRSGATTSQTATVGRLVALDGDGVPLVAHHDGTPRPARLAAECPRESLAAAIGDDVVLLFEDGRAERPIIVGWLIGSASPRRRRQLAVRIDGERVTLEAGRELELRCGESRILLTADGRITIEGRSVLSQAKELQRIRGAAVRIN